VPDKPWEPSRRERRVLLALLADAHGCFLYGSTLIRVSQTGSGTVYPVLARMESRGWVLSESRDQLTGQPRKCYSLTPEGRKAALGFLKLED
jgi:DNA-binding MarR family transcriptional regulator